MPLLLLLLLAFGAGLYLERKLRGDKDSLDNPPIPQSLAAEGEVLDDKAIAEDIAKEQVRQAGKEAKALDAEEKARAQGIKTHREGNLVIPEEIQEDQEAYNKRFREWASKNMSGK